MFCGLLVQIMEGHESQTSAAILDVSMIQSTSESGDRGAFEGANQKKKLRMNLAVGTLGFLLVLLANSANTGVREQGQVLAKRVTDRPSNRYCFVDATPAWPPSGAS